MLSQDFREGLDEDARVAGFGPLQPYVDDPSVEKIWINEPQRVFVARGGGQAVSLAQAGRGRRRAAAVPDDRDPTRPHT